MNIVGLGRCLVFLYFLFTAYATNDIKNFGPYDVPIIRSEACKSPKKDVARVSAIFQHENNNWVGHFNITYLENTKFEQHKMAVYSIKNNVKTLLYTYNLHEPCQHFLYGSFIKQMHNSTSCNIKKGFYSASFNISEILRSLLGTSFFFGDYMFKTNISAKNGNICCYISFISFTKKEEKIEKKHL